MPPRSALCALHVATWHETYTGISTQYANDKRTALEATGQRSAVAPFDLLVWAERAVGHAGSGAVS